MNFQFKKILPHLLVLLSFVIIAVAYFSPVLEGKSIYQSDIVQYIGMAKQQNDFRKETGKETYWTDSAFGGMPTYQLGAHYPYNFMKDIDHTLRFLPRPADYLFLYFIGLYILLLVLKVDYRIAFLGALAFGFSTYMIILLGVGHNSKAHAIAYMPTVLAGILLTFRRKYLWGGLLLAFSMALEVEADHPQMTFYLLLLVIVLGIVYLIEAFKKKTLPEYFKALGVMVIAVILALGANASMLMATKQYSDFSTRGDTGLTIDNQGNERQSSGLTYEYITEYSYGKLESFNLFIPRFMGGSSSEKLSSDSNSYKELLKLGANTQQATQFTENAPTYWGPQTYIGAPAYIGATVIFLFVLALFLIRGKLKWWVVGGSILALLLSWGDHFAFLTKFFINYFPLYNKFRAVSSIQVIIELCVPLLGVVGLAKVFQASISSEEKLHALKWSVLITGGLALVFFLFGSSLFDFVGTSDRDMYKQLGPNFVSALREDRQAMLSNDALRSLIFVLLCAGVIWFFLKDKLSKNLSIAIFAILILIDLISVDKRYVNNDDFVNKSEMSQPFQASPADAQILEDKGHYRVLDLSSSPLNSSRASYFHNSLGGYHAAKPGRMQELFDFYIYEGKADVIDMLNTKYTIIQNQGEVIAQPNPKAFGNAWFVNQIDLVNSVNGEMTELGKINPKETAVINKKFAQFLPKKSFEENASDTIQLINYQPDELTYSYDTSSERLALFSEIYYPQGWKATVDGKELPIVQANYVLRGVMLPKGKHQIKFTFDPQVVKTGSGITLVSLGILFVLLVGGVVYTFKKKPTARDDSSSN